MSQSSNLSANELHQQAMDFANRAVVAEKQSEVTTAKTNFKKAFELEKRAAMSIMFDFIKEPIRSVLFRSATFLAIKATMYREAERMAAFGLCGNPPAEIANELRAAFSQSQRYLKQVA
ncbi:MAG: hypothetical protein AAGJ18_26430 [Bacteroidota bacterium]